MTQAHRTGEEGIHIPFRSSRYFCVGTKWYFTTREGFDSGPYSTRDRAEAGLARFLKVATLVVKPAPDKASPPPGGYKH